MTDQNRSRDLPYDQQYQEFLVRLRSARHDVGLTQQEVASLLNKSQTFVSRSENGERRVDIVELRQFAQIYGKPISFFLDETD